MRVLILSAILACVSAAPSLLVPPTFLVPPYGVLAVAPLAVAPEEEGSAGPVPPGEDQAAAIDAQVKTDDQARSVAEQEAEKAQQEKEVAEQEKWKALNDAQVAEAAASAADAGSAGEAEAAAGEAEEANGENGAEDAEVGDKEEVEEKAEDENAAKPEKLVEGEKSDDVEAKGAAPEAPKVAGVPACKSAVFPSPIGIAPGFNFNPYVAPISYQASYGAYPFAAVRTVSAFPNVYHPAIAVTKLW